MTKPNVGGAPLKLTPKSQKAFLKVIRLTGFYSDACAAIDIDESTFAKWRARAAVGDEPFVGFFKALKQAEIDRRNNYITESKKRGAKKNDPREIQWRAAVTDPDKFSIKHHLVVQQQLDAAIVRLKERFGDRPLILEEILSAIAGESRGGGAGADAGAAGAVLSAGGAQPEADSLPTITTTIGVPRPGG